MATPLWVSFFTTGTLFNTLTCFLTGDDNEAMEGFRFWKQGYWKDALRGKPYHIRYAHTRLLKLGN